ncbi:MAG: NosD domain-containing protein [Planctomycetota bacterium]
MKSFFCIVAVILLSPAISANTQMPLRHFTSEFVEPTSTYITNHTSETIKTLNISSGSISDIQNQIDSERSKKPDSIIVVNLSGTYTVGSSPLSLPYQTCLILDGTLQADGSTTANCLIEVTGTYKTSISGGLIDGAGEDIDGIKITDSKFIHIDNVRIQGCSAGINYYGKGNTTWNAGSAISRCEVGDCITGIRVFNATQVLVMDSYIYRCQNGIVYSARHGTIYNNVLANNDTGILSLGEHNLIHQCRLYLNATAIRSESSSNNNIYTKNQLYTNGLGLYLAGSDDVYYANHFNNDTDAQRATAADTFIVPEPGDNVFSVSGVGYFNPPTLDNPDVTNIINGMSTHTLTISGGDISDVQAQLDAAYSSHSGKVIVLKLDGTFNGDQTLTLGSYTCVVLNGTIHVNHSGDGVAASDQHYISFSGGTINGQGNAYHGIDFTSGVKHSLIDSVEVTNCVYDLVHLGGSSVLGEPIIVTRCNIHTNSSGSTRRALWTQTIQQVITIDNRFANSAKDGIDNDSYSKYCYNIDNLCEDNDRYGIFIEIEAEYTNSIGNILRRNDIGINVFADADYSVHYNSVICNDSYDNLSRGLRYAGQGGLDGYSSDGFSFNNVCYGNDRGLYCYYSRATRNYFCQDVLYFNTTDDLFFNYNSTEDNNLFNPPLAPFSGFTELAGDLNVDDTVDLLDLSILTSEWLNTCEVPHHCNGADIDESGSVGMNDFSQLAGNWLAGSL